MPTVKMRALRKFRGVEGDIRAGHDFEARDRYRADELEQLGLATREGGQSYGAAKAPKNKAAQAGPMHTGGGRTGAAAGPSSSRAGRAPQGKPKGSKTSKR